MRIIKKEKEEITIIPENLKDLWFLYNKIDDLVVEQKTLRTKSVKKAGEILKGKKIPQIVAIKVEKKKWDGDKVRATGKIVSEADRNKYHSLDLGTDKKIKLKGELKNLPEAEKYEIVVCIVDRQEADIRIYKSGKFLEFKKVQAKGRENEFYKEVASGFKNEKREILLAGPGTTKEKIQKLSYKEIVLDSLNYTGEKGFKELMKRKTTLRIVEKIRERAERKMVEGFLSEIRKSPEKVSYGSELEKSPDKIKEILVLSSLVPKYGKILIEAEKNGAKINIVLDNKEYCEEIRKFEIVGLLWW